MFQQIRKETIAAILRQKGWQVAPEPVAQALQLLAVSASLDVMEDKGAKEDFAPDVARLFPLSQPRLLRLKASLQLTDPLRNPLSVHRNALRLWLVDAQWRPHLSGTSTGICVSTFVLSSVGW
ncbi:hypothetical protein ABID21_002004 [Pseudorhizobium tarimense]|uniref:Uncharacterized protein n=1 Tax=Pseudorhizobium tarimense TaxID=1079109 RepID=A0ABV2H5U4_9HYPH|nr:hypothetical protein [Pseudorhizobium tarimense]MCJ8519269.1 hypothetical protein [Pseudorhizobium tarimense]